VVQNSAGPVKPPRLFHTNGGTHEPSDPRHWMAGSVGSGAPKPPSLSGGKHVEPPVFFSHVLLHPAANAKAIATTALLIPRR